MTARRSNYTARILIATEPAACNSIHVRSSQIAPPSVAILRCNPVDLPSHPVHWSGTHSFQSHARRCHAKVEEEHALI